MHQTTCGETRKIEIFDKDHVERFLKEEKISFDSYQEHNSVIYSNKKVIDNSSLNYLNHFFSQEYFKPSQQLKSILKREFDNCEKLYPYLGEVFLNLFFNKKIIDRKKGILFLKTTSEIFLKTSKDKNAQNIVRWIINNSSTDRLIDIESSNNEFITFKKEEDIFFDIDYDCSFLGNKNHLEMKNYRFAIIDGFIESISEIHHMLHFAAQNKEPHVLFCFGMSEEVKNTIIQNNSKGITQILPVSMTIDEDTINILNDIALIHKSDIISSMKGQTISQEMRKELKIGNFITFNRKGFKIKPLCEKINISQHIKYLKKRIEESPPDANTDLIKKRIKNLNTKSLKIFVPKSLKEDVMFNRDLDYLLRMIRTSKNPYYSINIDKRDLMIPCNIFKYVTKKVNATKEIFYNLDKLIIEKE